MPKVKTTETVKRARNKNSMDAPVSDIQHLISKLLGYELSAKEHGLDLTSGRFKMLTNSERDFLRAELVADYIRLSAGNTGNTPGFFDASLVGFCSKLCDLEIPSHELLGTYLAAANVVKEDNLNDKIPGFDLLIRNTMVSVLQKCADLLEVRAAAKTRKALAG